MKDGFDLTVHGLVRKRAETVGQIEAIREQLSAALAELGHLDAAIRIFEPDIDLTDAPMKVAPPSNAAFRGEMARFLLNTLRQEGRPLTTVEASLAIMNTRGLDSRDKALTRLIMRRTGQSLSRLRRKGFVRSERLTQAGMLCWSAVRPEGYPEGGWRNGHTAYMAKLAGR